MTSSTIRQNIYCIAHLKLTDQRYQWQCEFNSAIFQSLHFQVNQVSQILARMKGWRFQIILVGGKNVYGPGLWPIWPFSSNVLSLLITFLWFSCDTAATLPYTVEWYEWEEGMWQCNNFYCFLASIHITRRSRPQCMHSHLAKPISTKTNKISHLASSDPHKHPESTIKQHSIGPVKCRHSNNTNGFTQIM